MLPIVIKPDIGCNGTGVRLVRSMPRPWPRRWAPFPRGVSLVLQAFVPLPGEAGIFYIRMPGEAHGQVTSLTLKTPPMVVGNGRSSLRALIMADPRHAQAGGTLYLGRLAGRLEEVPPQGEPVQLVFAGNHCKGSIFANGAADITPALTARIEAIARAIPDFHFGRFDVRFASISVRAAAGRGFPDHRNQRRRRGGHAYLGPGHVALGYLGRAATPLRCRVEDRPADARKPERAAAGYGQCIGIGRLSGG